MNSDEFIAEARRKAVIVDAVHRALRARDPPFAHRALRGRGVAGHRYERGAPRHETGMLLCYLPEGTTAELNECMVFGHRLPCWPDRVRPRASTGGERGTRAHRSPPTPA